MSAARENPCLTCSENQRCCSQLSGLVLSEEEYEKSFQKHADKLSIVKNDKVFFVTSQGEGPCPHWQISGCRIYHDRPIDCRVYPYEIIQVAAGKGRIEIKFRDSPCCPQTDHLLMPLKEAKGLLRDFGKALYGKGRPIILRYVRDEKDRASIFELFDPLMTWIGRILRVFRKNE